MSPARALCRHGLPRKTCAVCEAEEVLSGLAGGSGGEASAAPATSPGQDLPTRFDIVSRLSGDLYRTLLEQLPAVTFMTSFEKGHQEVYVSPQIEAILGYTPEEWLSNPRLWMEGLHPDDRARWFEEFTTAETRGATAVRSVFRFLHRDGRTVWIHGDVRIRRDPDTGSPVLVQAVGFDISDVKRAEEALDEIARKIREAFWTLTPELDRLLYSNAEFERIWGPPKAMEGRRASDAILETVHPDDRAAVARALGRLQTADAEFEHRLAKSERWVRSRTFRVQDAQGRVQRIIVLTEDVTERKALEEQIRRANEKEKEDLRSQVAKEHTADTLVGSSEPMTRLRTLIQKAARSSATVMITGESGTGKELVAQAIHYGGPRARRPFVAVNCAAFPDTNLLHSELFGHKKGAFTGAIEDRKGCFEEAHGGTLFLDEIGDMPAPVQAMILRAVQEQKVVRLGENQPRPVDVRLVAATHKDVDRLIKENRFREDLYYRLRVVTLDVPPLRERLGDVPELARHFLARANRSEKTQVRLSDEALELLTAYSWTANNVRELQRAVERAVVLCDGQEILPEDLPSEVTRRGAPASPPAEQERLLDYVDRLKRDRVLSVLRDVDGNRAEAARILGLKPRQLEYLLTNLGIEIKRRDRKWTLQEVLAALRRADGNVAEAAGLLEMTLRQFEDLLRKLGIDLERMEEGSA